MENTVQATQETEEQTVNVEEIRAQIRALNKGIVVDILEIENSSERDSYITIKTKILSHINDTPSFGDVKLRFPRQAVSKLKGMLGKVD